MSIVTFDRVTIEATFDTLAGATGGAPSTDDILATIWQDALEEGSWR